MKKVIFILNLMFSISLFAQWEYLDGCSVIFDKNQCVTYCYLLDYKGIYSFSFKDFNYSYFNENEAGFTTGFKKEENPYFALPVYRKKIGYGTSLES